MAESIDPAIPSIRTSAIQAPAIQAPALPAAGIAPPANAAEVTLPGAEAAARLEVAQPLAPIACAGLAAPGCETMDIAPSGQAAADWDLSDLRRREALAIAPDERGYRIALAEGACRGDCPMGPPTPAKRAWADHVPGEYATHRGFFKQAGTITTELLLVGAYFSVQSGSKFFKETSSFHFHDEGWFGKNTSNVGVDKLAHAFNTYLLADIIHARLHETTNASQGDALTAGIMAAGFMALNEISDAIEPDAGYSMQDVTMNIAGAAFSVLRNTVPGVKEKVSFKVEIVPNDQFYTRAGKPHYAQQRFMFSLKGAGFPGLRRTPLRFVDLQVGYFASRFLNEDRAAGREPKRHLFVGLGLNVGELLFGESNSGFGKAGRAVLDYLQLPYTSIRYDTTGRLGN
ncbi:DUF2279 domain-containing protein [Novosphingobium sp. CF614]|uniref:DUF2279 domain-containing protein n=1 Tax=Novosphingobium sp. CF614 TaxID=1884364 RepID=UPI0015A56B3C|nr:DUF2279 domain-containing protein [Novosphingobium sp. CF614]